MLILFLLPQTDEFHSRYLVWRNCRGGANFSSFLVAIAYLPLTVARRVAAFPNWLRRARTVQDFEDYEVPPSAARELGVLHDGLPAKALSAVVSEAKATVPVELETQLHQAIMLQFAAAAKVPDAMAGDLLTAAAAAAAAAAAGGSVWDTSLPFSAAVRQRRFCLTMAVVFLALIIRAALSTLVVVEQRLVQVC